jgi:hypothetical protein
MSSQAHPVGAPTSSLDSFIFETSGGGGLGGYPIVRSAQDSNIFQCSWVAQLYIACVVLHQSKLITMFVPSWFFFGFFRLLLCASALSANQRKLAWLHDGRLFVLQLSGDANPKFEVVLSTRFVATHLTFRSLFT